MIHLRIWLLLCGLTIKLASCGVLHVKEDALSMNQNRQTAEIEKPSLFTEADIADGIDSVSNELLKRRNRHKGQLKARSCKTRNTEEITSYYVIKGNQHQMSDDECGPGTITSSTSRSFQRGFAIQLGVFHVSKPLYLTTYTIFNTSMKPTSYLGDAVEKLVPTGQFTQASGRFLSLMMEVFAHRMT
ncbi:uncharacterized protein N7446_010601 [Penicillium canescens]|uniref:Uncharacterized protein n=1 Tax=Penicillium canescens TaxID=5083 RepID=A0AAD6IC08_PENCN|nr:uncharacterized protein N7446_010601 [Penicillium canescens]KAJ6041515.1 hypothetical protein N7460_006905 [Penicillium canescens]KAJ6050492.1 hypothetical protein N7446_010601 [Penicillium canescens]KAJ6064793.1 hypothetical protein N7444_000446 [Penicillium canescens]